MTPREKHLLRESFQSVAGIAGPLAMLFYGRLFELDPSLRPMFRQDIAVQARKLMDMLEAVIGNLDRLDQMTPQLRAMGQRHTAYGVRPEHYRTVEQALIWALGQAMEEDFDVDVKAAWHAIIGVIASTMQDGAAELPPR